MPNKTRGVGLFTAENLVAVLRAIPESDGTYRDVARKAEQYGGNVQYHTISNWASHGRADIEASQPTVNRLRQIHQTVPRADRRALRTGHQPEPRIRPVHSRSSKRTCECSNDKMMLPDGKLGNTCQECQDLDAPQRRRTHRV